MKSIKTVLPLIIIFSSVLFAYQDYDIDGVEDKYDRCPNTPFDKLVDENGCPQNDTYKGSLTLKIGSDIYIDNEYESANNLNFFINYRYNEWDISVSNASYALFDTQSNTVSDSGDIYTNIGYQFKKEKLTARVTLGYKFSTADIDETADTYMGTGESDYLSGINVSYLIRERQNIFLYYGYSLIGDSDEYDYENRRSYSVGSAYAITNSWYSALSYEGSNSIYSGVEDYKAISWFNSYSFSETFFTTLNYSYALDTLSYDHSVSVKLGVSFE